MTRSYTLRGPDMDRAVAMLSDEEYAQRQENDRLRSELEELRGFAQSLFVDWPESGVDGFELQDLGEKHGLLRATEATESCGEGCNCVEYGDFPLTCYRKTALLTGLSTLTPTERK